jgi:prepilin-type N-terminal cleavage/methylation domain-containing protein
MSYFPAHDSNKVQKGFTLVELLVTVTIIVLLSGAAIPSFNNYLRGQTVKQAQDQFKNDMRTLQNKALTGALSDTKLDVRGSQVQIQFWGIHYTAGTATYDYFISTGNNDVACNNDRWQTSGGMAVDLTQSGQAQGQARLPDTIQFKGTAGDKCIFFSIKDGSINIIPSIIPSHVTVGYNIPTPPASDCRWIYFNPTGAIYTLTGTPGSCN